MKIQIVGTNCSSSSALTKAAEEAAQSLGLDYELEKVTNLEHMVGLGVTAMPALAVHGVVQVQGRVPGMEELREILTSALTASLSSMRGCCLTKA
jgi:small redox-active disulfide protein 2